MGTASLPRRFSAINTAWMTTWPSSAGRRLDEACLYLILDTL
jgi:hypothetical protein